MEAGTDHSMQSTDGSFKLRQLVAVALVERSPDPQLSIWIVQPIVLCTINTELAWQKNSGQETQQKKPAS